MRNVMLHTNVPCCCLPEDSNEAWNLPYSCIGNIWLMVWHDIYPAQLGLLFTFDKPIWQWEQCFKTELSATFLLSLPNPLMTCVESCHDRVANLHTGRKMHDDRHTAPYSQKISLVVAIVVYVQFFVVWPRQSSHSLLSHCTKLDCERMTWS